MVSSEASPLSLLQGSSGVGSTIPYSGSLCHPPPFCFSLALCLSAMPSFVHPPPLPFARAPFQLCLSSLSLFSIYVVVFISLPFSLSLFLYRLHCPHLSFFLDCPLKCSFFFLRSRYSSIHHPSPFSRM